MEKTNQFMTGNQAAVRGAIDAGATIMFGYPITPATEILENWISEAEDDSSLDFLQTEDEIAAGFGVIGAVLGGAKSFTASAGPGHVLLQDPISMAENMRLPFVGIMMQRGGPSTGTVNYSQQEVTLAAFGGNGDGLRIVYSASSVEEMYSLTMKAFESAWAYRFPAILLGDGYIGKMKATVQIQSKIPRIKSEPILQETLSSTNLRNCYSDEDSFAEVLSNHLLDWEKARNKLVMSECYKTSDAQKLIVAHGSVANAAKDAIDIIRTKGSKIGLFRPVSINPFDSAKLIELAQKVKHIYIIESSLNQLSKIVKYELSGMKVKIVEIAKPAVGFVPEEIIEQIRK